MQQFQSTPPVSGERCHLTEKFYMEQMPFQSTPPVSGERCIWFGVSVRRSAKVSIHAPRFRGAMLSRILPKAPTQPFQSTPPVSGERCPTLPPVASGP